MSTTAAVLPLAGVAVGAVLSWGTGSLSERSRFRRERRSRLQDARVAAYADFSAAAKETMSILFRVAASRGLDAQTESMSLDDARPLLAAAYHGREAAFERVRLIGDDAVWQAARRWVNEVYAMRRAVDDPDLTAEAWDTLVAEANAGRSEFHSVARREIE